jgi:hypothetical protein
LNPSGNRTNRHRHRPCTANPRAFRAGAQEDDATMANDVMALDERIGRLEDTVASGFTAVNNRIDTLDGKVNALDARMNGFDDRLGRLEVTVAQGFFEHAKRMDRSDQRMDAMNHKMDVGFERLEGKIQTVLEHLDTFKEETRRNFDAFFKESRADRRLMYSILRDHGRRAELR